MTDGDGACCSCELPIGVVTSVEVHVVMLDPLLPEVVDAILFKVTDLLTRLRMFIKVEIVELGCGF